MQKDRTIALFIDVDNGALNFSQYESIINQVSEQGEILYGKLYGVSDRKHKEIVAHADQLGFDVALAMRIKKRGAKALDTRLIVDVVETAAINAGVDTIAVVAGQGDLVYLYRHLKEYSLEVIGTDNGDEASTAMLDMVLALDEVAPKAAPKKPVAKKPAVAPKAEPKAQAKPAEKPAQPKAEPKANADVVDETEELLKQIEKMRADVPETQEEPAVAPQEERLSANKEDNDLIKKIEEIRSASSDDDTDELIAKLQSLFEEE